MRHHLLITLVLGGCGGSPGARAISVPSAQVSDANNKCGAYAIRTGELTVEGELVRLWVPCWDLGKAGERYRVRTDPATTARLAAIERTQCIGLSPRALERSPFAQDDAIAEVVPHRGGTTIRGVHVVFKPIPGLTQSWMRRAIACHQARWTTLGSPASYLAGDPTLVKGAEVRVSEVRDHLEVLISTDSPSGAQLALDRAQDLTSSRTASRPRPSPDAW